MGQTNYDNKLQVKESTCHYTRYQSSSPQSQDTRTSERIVITLVHIYEATINRSALMKNICDPISDL